MKILFNEIKKDQSFMPIVFIDIGARWGIQRPWDKLPREGIVYYGLDADAEECKRLNAQTRENNMTFIPAALSDNCSNEVLYVTKEAGCSSIFKPNYEYVDRYYYNENWEIKCQMPLKTTTLMNVFRDNNIKPDFMKIDTQGAELKILNGAGNCLDEILGLELEAEFLPIYQGQPLFSDIDSFVRNKGFELYDLNRYWGNRRDFNKYNSSKGQLIFADAIYFRTIKSLFASNPDKNKLREKLLKMVAMFCLYDFFDVAYEYLNCSHFPFNNEELRGLNSALKSMGSYSKKNAFFLNNKVAIQFSKLLLKWGNMISFMPKINGWGTDYNLIERK